MEGEILETEIEIEDLFADQESNCEEQLILNTNQQLNTSYFNNWADTDIKSVLAILLGVGLVIGVFW